MKDEIFGPILCIIPINNMNEGIEYVRSHSRPLALYIFAENDNVINQIIHSTSSGGVGVNHCLYKYIIFLLFYSICSYCFVIILLFQIDFIYLIQIYHLVE